MGNDREAELLPARMLNEFTYCPRLFHLEHVDGLFADNAETVEGRSVHRRVDAKDEAAPDPDAEEPPAVARSVMLSSEELGLIAKIDVLETDGDTATPVDTKRGRRPDVPEGAYEPERVQLCAQGLLLREHGFVCDHGFLYFAGSRSRVRIDFDDALVSRTKELAAAAREAATAETPPRPLVDSPKCPRCSLVGICLPDEVNHLRDETADTPARRLIASRPDGVSVHVQGRGLTVSKRGENLEIKDRREVLEKVHLKDVEHVAVFGSNHVTTPALQTLAGRGVPVAWFSQGGWFYGVLHGHGLKNVFVRRDQFRAADDPDRSLALARSFVAGKIANCRTLLMRNHVGDPPPSVVGGLKAHRALAKAAPTVESLLGIEGNAARLYFSAFAGMLKAREENEGVTRFDFQGRNRRPPRDPVNAMLSLAYALLAKDVAITLTAVGLDPYIGFFHRPRHGRPALALDLMEEMRPIIADSVVLTAVNNGELRPADFIQSKAGCALKDDARRRFIGAYARRMDALVTHPVFDYRISYRRVLEVQARLLGQALQGSIPEYVPFTTR